MVVTSLQPRLFITHMIKLLYLLNMSITDTKHMNLTPCGFNSAEIFQRIDMQKIQCMTSTLIKHASAYTFYSEYTRLYI